MDNKIVSMETQKQMEAIKEWASEHKEFPKFIEDRLFLRFLHSCYYDVDKAKVAMEVFFTIRNSSPELMCNRDPLSPDMQKMIKIVNAAQYKISGNRYIWVCQLNDPGLRYYDHLHDAKLFILRYDAWLLIDDYLAEGDVFVIDLKSITWRMLTKFSMSVAKKLTKYQEEAMPVRIQEIHMINCPPIVDMIFALMKPLIKKSSSLIHFHKPNSNTLFDYINKEDLPVDFGGTKPKLEELSKNNTELLIKNRDRLMDVNLWRIDSNQNKETDAFKKDIRSITID